MITQWQKNEKYLDKFLFKLPEYAQLFLRHSAAELKPTTLYGYAKDIHQFLTWLKDKGYVKVNDIYDTPTSELEELFREDLEEFRTFLIKCKNSDGEDFKISTINRKLSSLKSLFHYLEKTEKRGTRETYIRRNPFSQITLMDNSYSDDVRVNNIQNGILVQQEIKHFRDFVADGFGELHKDNLRIYNRWESNKERDAALIALILGTGLRISEVVDIRMTDIDLKSRSIMVYRKSGYKRSAKYSKTAEAFLLQYLEIREKRYPGNDEFLFLTKYKGASAQMNKRSMQKMIKKYAEAFDKPNATAHKLRHSFATNHYSKNKDLRVLQDILDHASPQTTMIYSHIFDSEIIESIDFADSEI